jgi:hypothetical protein
LSDARYIAADNTHTCALLGDGAVGGESGRSDGAPRSGNTCNWGIADRNKHPINCVTWGQAEACCKWVDRRLPTDAEWEKAARGPNGRRYPWGDGKPTCELVVMAEDTPLLANPHSCGKGLQPRRIGHRSSKAPGPRTVPRSHRSTGRGIRTDRVVARCQSAGARADRRGE